MSGNADNKILPYAIHESVPFGIILSIVGGFLDAYTFIDRGGVFANAQTGNIVLMGVYGAQGAWGQALSCIPPIIAFMLGVLVTESLKSNAPRIYKLEWIHLVLIFEILLLFIIGFIPPDFPDIAVTVAVSFAASVQVCSFNKLVDSQYNTTMHTGNLKYASQAIFTAITKKDRQAAVKAYRYFVIIVTFIIGGFLGGLLTLMFSYRAVWGAMVILAFALVLFLFGERKSKDVPT